jgi:hypothetical protein
VGTTLHYWGHKQKGLIMPSKETLNNEITAFYELLLGLSDGCVLSDDDTDSLESVDESAIVSRLA